MAEAGLDDTGPIDIIDEPAVRDVIWPHLRKTTLIESEALSNALGAQVTLALEAFQHTGSFKARAALAVAMHTQADHLLTVSSGNFGAALAWAARRTGKRATVIMPGTSSPQKIAAVKAYGGEVDVFDPAVTNRRARLAELEAAYPEAHVASPYDDAHVIAGNSTLGFEILEQLGAVRRPDAILAPVGGGGLTAGLVKARDALARSVEVIGAEPATANDAARSLRAGVLSSNEREPTTICDGARTPSLGQRNFAVLRRGLSRIVEVPDEQVIAALRLLFIRANVKAEPTAALPVAALLTDRPRFHGKRLVCVISGANVDPKQYASWL